MISSWLGELFKISSDSQKEKRKLDPHTCIKPEKKIKKPPSPKIAKVDPLEAQLQASYLALQRKADQYEELHVITFYFPNQLDGNDSENEDIMVDFLKKSVTSNQKHEDIKSNWLVNW